jgi:hypothetical protein
MARNSWSFGLLRPHYAIADDRVVIARNVWLPFALLAVAAPGIWCLVQEPQARHFDGMLFGLGFVGTMVGLFAVIMTPWLSPGQIVFTRDGMRWGGKTVPLHAITKVHTRSVAVRLWQSGKYLSWSFGVELTDGKALSLSLGDHRSGTSTAPLENLERAIAGVFTRHSRPQ